MTAERAEVEALVGSLKESLEDVEHALGKFDGGSFGLCESCNYAKQAPAWRASPSSDSDGHEIETVLPSGHRYRSRPPPIVATIRRAPIRLDYVLAG